MGTLDDVDEQVRCGAFLDAWSALAIASPEERGSGRGRSLGVRLRRHLGAPKRARREMLRHHRDRPEDPHARLDLAFARLELRGPFDAWEWARQNPIAPAEGRLARAAMELEAATLIALRDFTAARSVLDRWREQQAGSSDLAMCEAQLLAREDRLADALATARRALDTDPTHRRLVIVTAGLLVSSGEARESAALLRRASDEMQCGMVAEMLFSVAIASDEHRHASRAVERLSAVLPQAEAEITARIARMRDEAAYRTSEAPRRRRVVLDVPFVRQEHLGCAPATLASISQYFGRPADHLELAERICFHGTPAHAERTWAESQGYLTREMRLTWDVAVALIGRKIPFHISTFVPGNGHAQAVMGYDEERRTLILRDPASPLPVEVDADAFLATFRHCGPRCLLFVPPERAAQLEGIELDDAPLYDALYEVERALAAHDRQSASAACGRLGDLAPGHLVSRAARRALAAYDDNPVHVLAIAREALAADPEDRLALLDCLTTQLATAPRAVRARALEEAATGGAPPIFLELLASELSTDAREHGRARRLAQRALAAQPDSSRSIEILARIAWDRGDASYALRAFRFAACLSPTHDGHVRNYAIASLRMRRYEEALAFLQECERRLGGRAAAPAILLADALDEIGDATTGAHVLERASARRPEDGELLLARSKRAVAEGRVAEARALVESARAKIDEVAWARGAAMLAAAEGLDEDGQLAAWQRVADAAPLATDAQANVASLLRRTKGHRAAADHLASCVARFPHHRPTVRAHLEALREASPAERERALRAFLATEPADAWGHRELALVLASAQRHDEARAVVEGALRLEGRSAEHHLTCAVVAEQRGDADEARRAYMAALDADAGASLAVFRLVELSAPEARQLLISNLFEKLERTAVSGESFEALHAAAVPHVGQDWLGAALDRLRGVRPEVPATWLLSIRHALAARPSDVAVGLATGAVARFPLVPDAHLEAAEAFSIAGDADRALHHLERAVELGPQNARALARLTNALEARGERARVDAILDDARRRARFDGAIALERIRIRARRGETLLALSELAVLLEREPDLDAAWGMLSAIAGFGARESAAALELSARLVSSQPASVAAHASHAFLLLGAGKPREALVVLEAAAHRGLRSVQLRDATASALALSGRHAEALAVCAKAQGEVHPPELELRAAWVYANAGDLQRAIVVMQDLLRVHGSMVGGWQQLVDLWIEAGNAASAVEAATRLVALTPMTSSAQQTLGRALLALGDTRGAQTAFLRAIERDPGAVLAAVQLFRLAADAHDRNAARAAMTVLEGRLPASGRVGFDVEIALIEGDQAAAQTRFAAACVEASADAGAVLDAWEALGRRGASALAVRIVDEVVGRADATAVAGALWMRAGLGRSGFDFAERLRDLAPSSNAGRGAAEELFDTVTQRAQVGQTKRIIKALRTWLDQDDVTWSAPFGALVTKRLYWRAAWWGRAWQARQATAPARLHTLAVALHASGLRRRAMELTRHVVERATDVDARSFRAWIAFDEAALGHTDRAERELAAADEGPVFDIAMYPRELARELVALQRAPHSERPRRYAERRGELERILIQGGAFPSLRNVRRRCRERLAFNLRRLSPLLMAADHRMPALTLPGLVLAGSLSRAGEDARAVSIVFSVLFALAAVWVIGRMLVRALLARV